MHIGVAGLGAMGAPIAARLMEVGHQVTVWNRSPEKTKPLADAGDNWDTDPWLLCVENGVVDLRTGTLRNGMPS